MLQINEMLLKKLAQKPLPFSNCRILREKAKIPQLMAGDKWQPDI